MGQASGSLPASEQCLQYLRDCRFGDRVTCPHCDGTAITRKGQTAKGARQYRCKECESYFNDLTGTVFAGHQLSVGEMCHIIRGMNRRQICAISRDLDRTYKTVLEFTHEVERRNSDLVVHLREAVGRPRPTPDG